MFDIIINQNESKILPFIGTLKVHQVYGNSKVPNKIVLKSLSCLCSKDGRCYHKLGELNYSNLKNKKTVLLVDKVYSESDSEYTDSENEALVIPVSTAQKQTAGFEEAECSGVGPPRYMPGDYLLVKLCSRKKTYKYVAICLCEVDEEEGEIKVTFLKVCSKDGTIFKVNDNDVSYIRLEDIITLLPIPTIMLKGDRCFYTFSKPVDVLEQ